MSSGGAVSNAVRQLVAKSLQDFVERHPDGPIKKISLSDVDIRDTLVSLIQPRANHLVDLEQRVREGQLPLGVLSAAAGRPLGLALLQRAVGHINAGTDDPELYDQELESARNALEGRIVADTSAIYISMLSGHSTDLRRKFRSIVTSRAVSHDIDDAYRDSVGILRSGLSMGYDPDSSSLRISEETESERARMSERAEALKNYVDTFERVEVGVYELLTEFDDSRNRVWSEPLEHAGQAGIAFYCDDVSLRAVARSLSVPTFGTLALLHALIESASITDITMEVIEKFMQEYIVDLPYRLEELLLVAAREGYQPGAASYALSRRSMWLESDTSQESFDLLRQVHASNPSADEAWLVSALLGASASRPGSNIVGLMASFWLARVSGLDRESYNLALRAARTVAEVRGLPDPRPDLRQGIRLAIESPESPNWIPSRASREALLQSLETNE